MSKLKILIKRIVPAGAIAALKRKRRKLKNTLRFDAKASTLESLRQVLTEQLGITNGDRIFVTSGFANLKAKDYSPLDVVKLLKEIVGDEGLIMMPYYPPVNSMEWVKSGQVFDMRSTKSGMGVLTNMFAKSDGCVMSRHPFKAVCAWGNDAESIIGGHDRCLDPYGDDSPYGRMLRLPHSKSLCLGVINLPMLHAIEDKVQPMDTLFYDNQPYDVPMIASDGMRIVCHTLVHSPEKSDNTVTPGQFAKRFESPVRKEVKFGYTSIIIYDNTLMESAFREEFTNGYTRMKQ